MQQFPPINRLNVNQLNKPYKKTPDQLTLPENNFSNPGAYINEVKCSMQPVQIKELMQTLNALSQNVQQLTLVIQSMQIMMCQQMEILTKLIKP